MHNALKADALTVAAGGPREALFTHATQGLTELRLLQKGETPKFVLEARAAAETRQRAAADLLAKAHKRSPVPRPAEATAAQDAATRKRAADQVFARGKFFLGQVTSMTDEATDALATDLRQRGWDLMQFSADISRIRTFGDLPNERAIQVGYMLRHRQWNVETFSNELHDLRTYGNISGERAAELAFDLRKRGWDIEQFSEGLMSLRIQSKMSPEEAVDLALDVRGRGWDLTQFGSDLMQLTVRGTKRETAIQRLYAERGVVSAGSDAPVGATGGQASRSETGTTKGNAERWARLKHLRDHFAEGL